MPDGQLDAKVEAEVVDGGRPVRNRRPVRDDDYAYPPEDLRRHAAMVMDGEHDPDPIQVFALKAASVVMADQFQLPKYGGYEAVQRIKDSKTRSMTLAAMKDESANMWRKGVFAYVDEDSIEKGTEICKLTWALRAKPRKDGSLLKVKARLCLRGDLMKRGIHYLDSYSPVMSMA